ncbi:hypothetical protein D9756_008880 [Leucocoprinus leucothites]|uniref:N-acetyltransferase domain-containing protein n=1 Tax=Leucocoprinus leucothites TaxID=201217 RepID=A0A8H5FUK9_9AGAR|nr:hypothetical protein D9756_008880 [Leucoagaricus leucothites]
MPSQQTSNSEQFSSSEFDYRLRLYHAGDNKAVQALYLNVMVWQPHAPLISFLKLVAKSTTTKIMYLTSILGAAIWIRHPTLGKIISLAAIGATLLQFWLAFRMILSIMRWNVKEDLADLAKHYMLVPVNEVKGDNEGEKGLELEPSGPRGFWVVEATHRVSGKTELAGCGGLDIVRGDGKSKAVLRRMVVSNCHTRRGIAATVIKAVMAHAKAYNLPSIYLTTSTVQGPAIELYKKHGWVEEKRYDISAFGAKVEDLYMRLHLRD